MKILKIIMASSLMISIAPIAQAGSVFDLSVDGNIWSPNATVTIDNDSSEYDSAAVTLETKFEHSVPNVPNALVKLTYLEASRNLEGSDKNIDSLNTDLLTYYKLVDSDISVDVGVGTKLLSGNLETSGDNGGPPNPRSITETSLNQTLAMGYASVGAKLPMTGFSAKADFGYAKGSDADAIDAQAELKYDFLSTATGIDFGATAGYRMTTINYDSINDKKLKTEFKGPYVGMAVHF